MTTSSIDAFFSALSVASKIMNVSAETAVALVNPDMMLGSRCSSEIAPSAILAAVTASAFRCTVSTVSLTGTLILVCVKVMTSKIAPESGAVSIVKVVPLTL